MQKEIYNKHGIVVLECKKGVLSTINDIPNLVVRGAVKPHYYRINVPDGKQFPEGSAPVKWREEVTVEIFHAMVAAEPDFCVEEMERALNGIWKAIAHEGHKVPKCNIIQSALCYWQIHMYLPGGLSVRVRKWEEKDDGLRTPSFTYTTDQGRYTMIVESMVPNLWDARDWTFPVQTFALNLGKEMRIHYPFLLGLYDSMRINHWPNPLVEQEQGVAHV